MSVQHPVRFHGREWTSRTRGAVAALALGVTVATVGATTPALAASAAPAGAATAAAPGAATAAAASAPVVRTTTATIYFAVGSDHVGATARATLTAFVAALPAGADVLTVRIAGYVQRSADSSNDITLAAARAKTTALFLKTQSVSGAYTLIPVGIYSATPAARRAVVTVAYRILGTQSITFTQPAAMTLRSTPQKLTATTTSGLPVTIRTTTPKICTLAGAPGTYTLRPTTTGYCVLTATQPGNSSYRPATNVSRGVAITTGLLTQTITFPALTTMQAQRIQPLRATTSSGLAVTYGTRTPSVCVISDGARFRAQNIPAGKWVLALTAGTCTVTADQPGSATYAPASRATRTLTVTPAVPFQLSQTISFTQPTDMTVGDLDQALPATATSGLPVTIESLFPEICQVLGAPGEYSLHAISTGPCGVRATQAGNTLYLPAPAVTYEVAILALPVAQTITFPEVGSVRVGRAPFEIGATSTSGLPVTIVSLDPEFCTISEGTNAYVLSAVSPGACVLRATQTGNANYLAATPVERTVTVQAAMLDQTITFALPADMRVGDPDQPLNATTTAAGLEVTIDSDSPGTCTVLGTPGTYTLHAVSAGDCIVFATQEGDATYDAAQLVSRTITISPALLTQTITFPQPDTMGMWRYQNVSATTDATGLTVSFRSATPFVCEINFDGEGWALHSLTEGLCTIVGYQDGDATYAPALDVSRDIVVAGAPAQQTLMIQPGLSPVTDMFAPPFLEHIWSPEYASGIIASSLTPETCGIQARGDGFWMVDTTHGVGTCTLQFVILAVPGLFAETTLTRSFEVIAPA